MIIAISGAAASGKGTLARMLATELNLPHYDFGLMFRAIAVFYAKIEHIEFKDGKVLLSGDNVTNILKGEDVGLAAAQMASEKAAWMCEVAQAMVKHTSFVCDGRTVGTEIYPNAEYRFYLKADESERITRRLNQGGDTRLFREREELDRIRLRVADGSIVIDTTGKTKEQCLRRLLSHIKR